MGNGGRGAYEGGLYVRCGEEIEGSAGWSPKEGHYQAAGCPEE